MSLKTEVIDRVPTYPGRVKLTPVGGQTNVYDMVRSDSPVTEGTPINKALFDQKAYTLTQSVTVYVATTGSDVTGDGSSTAPYATIQKAINELPKCLGGFHAQIDIAAGTYNERVTVDGFYGGRLTIGVSDRSVTVRGISVLSSDGVRINVSNITYSANYAGTLLYADYGSNVSVLSPLTLRGENAAVSAVGASRGGVITCAATVAILGCKAACVIANSGSRIVFNVLNGNTGNTSFGIQSETGAVVTYSTKGMVATSGDLSRSGGRILTDGGDSLNPASVG